ncbi:MAG: hypothetical protein HDR12_01470 [Lachnospiraceae bacterium]|nr:hypothetical protein [Lachnospiraceae bacterium]
MDKYEYKVRADEIKSLIAEGEYGEAVKIADTIDWRRVRSVMMLCTISDVYKINRRYQESNDILLLAYEKHPTGRLIVYSLCELAIKMEDYARAVEYFKEFVQIAPRDTGKYILQYRLYEAQEVRLEERIAVLEEFKKRDYREKWAYELAYLYHRIGLATKCIEECDEMYLWFGEGKYVCKALELKALHAPLSAEQQAKYNLWVNGRSVEDSLEEESQTDEENAEDEEISEEIEENESEGEEEEENEEVNDDIMTMPTTELPEVKTVDVGQYNTLNLQKALAESMKEVLEEDEASALEEAPDSEEELSVSEEEYPDLEEGPSDLEEPSIVEQIIAPLLQETGEISGPELEQYRIDEPEINVQETNEPEINEHNDTEIQTDVMRQEAVRNFYVQPSRYDGVLAQEYDGQISLVVPDEKKVEKQITGQLSIEDVMAEWEKMKKSNEQKRMEAVRQKILSDTGGLFAEFDEATKSGLLEQLEKVFEMTESVEDDIAPAVKKVIIPSEAELELNEDIQTEESTEDYAVSQEMSEDVLTEDDEVEELEEIEDAETVEEPKDSEAAEVHEEVKEPETVEPVKETEKPKDTVVDTPKAHPQPPQEHNRTVRELTDEEKDLFGPCVNNKKTKDQLIHTLDNMSMAAYTGNVIVTGEEGSALDMAKNLIREMQNSDSNFSGKAAKISGAVLNKKDLHETIGRLVNGALIIEKASGLNAETIVKLNKELEKYNVGLLLFMEDTKRDMNKLLAKNEILKENFNLRVDIEPLDNEALVACAKQYAKEMEYSIDEFGILALHTRISEMQTSDHAVTVSEVKELIDEAIYYANRKTPKHFLDILLAKRYDEEDMIVLRENDFMHN